MPQRTREQRSAAARKGWDTRRENQRRADAEARRRSERARKGWETRRKLGGGKGGKGGGVGGGVGALPPDDYDEPLDDLPSDEWEIGFSYRGADAGSAVDVNIRIAREDGAAFGVNEATRVLKGFQDGLSENPNNPIPAGYRMAFIDWQRPRWGTNWQSGDDADLVSFYAPMYTETDNPGAWSVLPAGNTRLGSVKK